MVELYYNSYREHYLQGNMRLEAHVSEGTEYLVRVGAVVIFVLA
jgi:hypothetical protein